MNYAIKVQNLIKKFGDFTAVDNISFEVSPGEFFGFLGPNGAGKTTTMRMLATLLKPTSGKAWINNYEIQENADGVRRSIGFAMQSITLDTLTSAYENLYLLGALYGMKKREIQQKIQELLKLLNLDKVANKWVKNYSGGMKRRLDLASVLIHEPKILFLDEPTEGLDPAGRRVIWDYLKKINKEKGITIFLTTHYMDEADYLCDRIAIIDKGKLVVINDPKLLKKEIKGSLDDVFIKFTGHKIQDEEINLKSPDPYVMIDTQ